jgi:hypothetical protein
VKNAIMNGSQEYLIQNLVQDAKQDLTVTIKRQRKMKRMGTQYRVINVTKKEIYDFGLNWNPKFREAIFNKEPARFLLFLMLDSCRGDYIKVISESNSYDWEIEVPNLFTEYIDKSEEMNDRFIQWEEEFS